MAQKTFRNLPIMSLSLVHTAFNNRQTQRKLCKATPFIHECTNIFQCYTKFAKIGFLKAVYVYLYPGGSGIFPRRRDLNYDRNNMGVTFVPQSK